MGRLSYLDTQRIGRRRHRTHSCMGLTILRSHLPGDPRTSGERCYRDCAHRLDRAVRAAPPRQARVYLPDQPFHGIWRRFGNAAVRGGHADSFATSICLYLRPDDVRMDRIINPGNQPVDWTDPNLDFSRYSATGVIGDPAHASADLGRQLWSASVQAAMRDLVAAANSA